MRTLITIFILLTCIVTAFGQQPAGKINGFVKDGNGKGLEAVTVSLRKKNDSTATKTAISDASGQFNLENIAFGKYILVFSHIGYTTQYSQPLEITASKPALSVNNVSLQATDGALGQVTVIGKRPLIENKIDKTVVNVDASTTNGGLTALEVLEKSPGVMVDADGNVSLKGKQGMIILIDGKPTYLSSTDLANYLRNMPANQLDQIEIMSQPPAKYDASGNSGVINLTTKKVKTTDLTAR